MSLLLTAVAVRHPSVDDVVDVVRAVFRDAGCRVEACPAADADGAGRREDVHVAPESGGWVTVHPHYTVPAAGLAVALTRRLGAVSSATSVYESVFWTHDLVSRGRVLDRHVNLPGYFGPGEHDIGYQGDAELVAEVLGVDPLAIAPYFRQVSLRRARSRRRPPPKAREADSHDLLDGWVITDLWARLGIRWGAEAPELRLGVTPAENSALVDHLRGLSVSPE